MLYPIAEQWTYLQVTHPDRDFEPGRAGPLLFLTSILPRPAPTTPQRPSYLFPDEWCLIKFWMALECVARGFRDICRSLEKLQASREPELGSEGFDHKLWVFTVGGFNVWSLARSRFLNKPRTSSHLRQKEGKLKVLLNLDLWSNWKCFSRTNAFASAYARKAGEVVKELGQPYSYDADDWLKVWLVN